MQDATYRFRNGIGNEGASAYDALNAVTEYFDHLDLSGYRGAAARAAGAAKAVSSAFDGHGAAVKTRARRMLLAAR